MKWFRPGSIPYPTAWSEHTGRRALSDGSVPTFVIEDAREDMFPEIVQLICGKFLQEVSEGTVNPQIEESSTLSRDKLLQTQQDVLDQKLTVVALHVAEDGTKTLAGINVSMIQQRGGITKGFASGSYDGFLNYMWQQADIFNRFVCNEFLMGKAIYVLPQYRGQGLGLELLRARVTLCKAIGLKATAALFITKQSQEMLGQRGGYELLYQMNYADYNENGDSVFPNIKEQMCQVMGLRIK